MKTIQVMQQTIFFYFGIDLRTTFQSPTDGRACQGPGMPRTSNFFQNSFKMAAEGHSMAEKYEIAIIPR